jgi:hypothetical protein
VLKAEKASVRESNKVGDHLEVLLNRVERGQSKNILGCGAGGGRDCRLSDPFRKRSPSSTVVDTVTAPEKRVQRIVNARPVK